MALPKIVYAIIAISLIATVGSAISRFLDIDFSSYGPYVLWFIALAIFFVILPSDRGSIFLNMSSN